MTLDHIATGKTCNVLDCTGDEKLKHRLETMGVVGGSQLFVHHRSYGNIIVEIKRTRIALGLDVAELIEVCE